MSAHASCDLRPRSSACSCVRRHTFRVACMTGGRRRRPSPRAQLGRARLAPQAAHAEPSADARDVVRARRLAAALAVLHPSQLARIEAVAHATRLLSLHVPHMPLRFRRAVEVFNIANGRLLQVSAPSLRMHECLRPRPGALPETACPVGEEPRAWLAPQVAHAELSANARDVARRSAPVLALHKSAEVDAEGKQRICAPCPRVRPVCAAHLVPRLPLALERPRKSHTNHVGLYKFRIESPPGGHALIASYHDPAQKGLLRSSLAASPPASCMLDVEGRVIKLFPLFVTQPLLLSPLPPPTPTSPPRITYAYVSITVSVSAPLSLLPLPSPFTPDRPLGDQSQHQDCLEHLHNLFLPSVLAQLSLF
ncbi:hypothetical protein B0H15DRAFT_1026445 [Mycena belliarum]|uniref:Uncharacterized protein n=1 Tax=Mycena belliarum TaxID=1033014 RepID=A0AAD6TTG7_9AGAR|nr:hypothetical protein B0H15DRAFT_1026445 [Mycena belliae]